MSDRGSTQSRQHAFTMIELLVVITIIGILLGLVVASGAKMIVNQQQARTRSILRALDRALEEFMSENTNQPPIVSMTQFANMPGMDLLPNDNEVDLDNEHPLDQPTTDFPRLSLDTQTNAYMRYVSNDTIYPRYPDASVFIEAVQGFGVVDPILTDLGDRLIPTPSDGNGGSNSETARSVTPSVVDAWYSGQWSDHPQRWPVFSGVPILYITRNNEMANQLYGQTVNKRPYFMSAGPDRYYGTTNELGQDSARDITKIIGAHDALKDNLYSYPVGGANLSDDFSEEYR